MASHESGEIGLEDSIAAYEKGLVLAPAHGWIKNVLLPELEKLESKQAPTGSGR